MDPQDNGGWEPVQTAPPPQNNPSNPPSPPQGQDTSGWEPIPPPSNQPPEGQHFASADPHPARDLIQHQPGEGAFMGSLRNAGGAIEGMAEGAAGTLAGGVDLVNRLTGHHIPNSVTSNLHAAAGEGAGGQSDASHKIGYGGETLAEFVMGDEALKALPMAVRLETAAKTMKVFEKSPKLMRALQIGAEALNTGARNAGVQGIQTLVRSGGDPEQTLKAAGTAGVLGTGLGAVGGVLGEATGAAGNAGRKVQELGDVAGSAPSKGDVLSGLQDQIKQSQNDLHADYDTAVKDYATRVGDNTVPYKDSSFHKAVTDTLGKGLADADPMDAALNKSRPGSARVNQMLEDLKDLADPKVETPKPEKWTDANGVTHTEPAAAAEAPEPIELNMQKLIEKRQLFRERMAQIKGVTSEDLADKAVYGKLLNGVDDTIGDLANKSGDPDIIDEYEDLRSNYKDKIGLYNNPVIKAITDGKPDDAARSFIGIVNKSGLPQAGKIQANLNALQKVLDPLGDKGNAPLQEFGSQVFKTMMKDASSGSGQFNASKFMDTWNRIDPETKTKLFDAGPDATSVVAQYAKDAKSVANVQRLTRVGLLGGIASPLHIPVPGLGLVGLLAMVNENAGVQAGRNVLDFVANHPWTWKTFRGLDSGAVRSTAKFARNAAVSLGSTAVADNVQSKEAAQKRAFAAAGNSLSGGAAPPPKTEGSDQAPATSQSFVTPSYDVTSTQGMTKPGNIDLNSRRDIKNPDGSHSSVFSMSFGTNDGEVLVPGVGDGTTYPLRKLTTKEALDQYKKTGKNLGTFKTPDAADAYGQTLHEDQARMKVINGVLRPQ